MQTPKSQIRKILFESTIFRIHKLLPGTEGKSIRRERGQQAEDRPQLREWQQPEELEQATAPRRAVEAGKARNSTNSQCMCTERLKKKLKTEGLTSERSSRVKKTQPKRFRGFIRRREDRRKVCFSEVLFPYVYNAIRKFWRWA